MSDIRHVLEVAVEPTASADLALVEEALREFADKNSNVSVAVDRESGLHVLRAASEKDLDAAIGSLKQSDRFKFNVGAPHVVYRETLSRSATTRYTHKKSLGPVPQFADVTIAFEPLPENSEFVFENAAPHIPREYIPAIEKGLRLQREAGLIAGFPVTDFKAQLVDGNYHEVDSSPLTFDIAARGAFRELATLDVAILLEPVMKVEVVTPDDFLGGVIGDLNSRRGRILNTVPFGEGLQAITAMVPLSCLFGYGTTLDAMTQGKGSCKIVFDHYAPVPVGRGGDDTFPQAMALRA